MTIRKSIWVLKGFICLAAGVIACWAGRCEAYEPWEGQVTVRLNVRQAPGRTSPVITQIDQGALVTVSDEREGWYKVTVEEETFGFIDWVHGKYVKDPNALSKTSSSPAIQKKSEPGSSPPATRTTAPTAPEERPSKEHPEVAVTPKTGSEKGRSADVETYTGQGERRIASESSTDSSDLRSRQPLHEESVKREGPDRSKIEKGAGGDRAQSDAVSPAGVPQRVRQQHVPTPAPSSRLPGARQICRCVDPNNRDRDTWPSCHTPR